MRRRRRASVALQRWVDHDLAKNFRPVSPMVGAAPIFLMWCFSRDVSGQWRAFGWSLAVGASAICIGFVGWRWWLIYRAAMLDADRAYDERIKYTLPPEYRDTESAGEVRRRKARERPRKG